MKAGKTIIILLGLLIVVLILAIGLLSKTLSPSYGKVEASIQEIRTEGIPDGQYLGSASTFPVKVRVRVSVSGGRIADIALLEHFNGQGKPAEAILPAILEKQSVKVDAISGATHSSLTILKAVADALEGRVP